MSDNNDSTESQAGSSAKGKKHPYPKSIFFILGNEFCERFTYYGLRSILTIYLTQNLNYSENSATSIYHAFVVLAYFSPVLGAGISDSWLGKFRTILFISMLYCCGSIVLASGSAIRNNLNLQTTISLVGLFVIGLGTGGIKPCVSAFGGDQFKESQKEELKNFFSVFYLTINLGSVISTLVTPLLRGDIHCLGEKTCFPAAFGVPSVLMIIAVFFFLCGKPFYVIRPPDGNIVLRVFKCICYAIGEKFCCQAKIQQREEKPQHWLDYADDKFDKKLIKDIKIVLKVFVLYIPLPLFWALFEQTASRWVIQATRLDGELGFYTIKADQMQVMNSLFIIIFIPVFDYGVYPLLDKCHLLKTPLKRITTGGLLAALSFVIAGFLELSVERYKPVLPDPDNSQLTIINNSPCKIRIKEANLPLISAFEAGVKLDLPLQQKSEWTLNPENCDLAKEAYPFSFVTNNSIESMMISVLDGNLTAIKVNDNKTKEKDGEPKLRVFYNIDKITGGKVSFLIKNVDYTHYASGTEDEVGVTDYTKFAPGKYSIYAPLSGNQYQNIPIIENHQFSSGGVYIISVYNKSSDQNNMKSMTYEMVKGNYVNILFQIPQYLILTAGEIMLSITGLEFSYSQSPNSMKSVVQAAWLLTNAFGNALVLVITNLDLFENMSYELFLFAVLMALAMIVFAILAYFYEYVTIKHEDAESSEEESNGRNKDDEESGASSPKESNKESNEKSNDAEESGASSPKDSNEESNEKSNDAEDKDTSSPKESREKTNE